MAWEEIRPAVGRVCSMWWPGCVGGPGRGRLKAVFAGELLQGVSLDSLKASPASPSTKISDAMSETASEAVDGMGDLGSEAQSVIDVPGEASASASAGQPAEALWFLVRGAYVANTHVVGELPLLLCCAVLPVLCCFCCAAVRCAVLRYAVLWYAVLPVLCCAMLCCSTSEQASEASAAA